MKSKAERCDEYMKFSDTTGYFWRMRELKLQYDRAGGHCYLSRPRFNGIMETRNFTAGGKQIWRADANPAFASVSFYCSLDFAEEPRAGVGPAILGCAWRDIECCGCFVNGHADEITQLYQFRLDFV
jgi:hypothetical protein